MTVVKICGIMRWEDAVAALEAGADGLGFVFAPSRRRVAPRQARNILSRLGRRPAFTAGIFVNEDPEAVRAVMEHCSLDYAQLCGDEPPAYCRQLGLPVIKSFPVQEGAKLLEDLAAYEDAAERFLLDSHAAGMRGGTGRPFDWALAQEPARRYQVMLAGGLRPENVAQAIALVRPWGVDVSSGVETEGRKDPAKIDAFIRAVKGIARRP